MKTLIFFTEQEHDVAAYTHLVWVERNAHMTDTTCFNCARPYVPGSELCPHCGARLGDLHATSPPPRDDPPKQLNAEELCQYAISVTNTILEPFAAGVPLISFSSGSTDPFTYGHRETFYLALSCMTVSLLSGKDDFFDSDAAFLRVVRKAFGPNYTATEDHLPVNQLKVFYQQTLLTSMAQSCQAFLGQVPLIFGPLQVYDTLHGTSFAEQVSAMFFRFANVVVKADGRIARQEEQQLANLKVLLWTPGIKVQPSAPKHRNSRQHPTRRTQGKSVHARLMPSSLIYAAWLGST
jgi:hypothetical protein